MANVTVVDSGALYKQPVRLGRQVEEWKRHLQIAAVAAGKSFIVELGIGWIAISA